MLDQICTWGVLVNLFPMSGELWGSSEDDFSLSLVVALSYITVYALAVIPYSCIYSNVMVIGVHLALCETHQHCVLTN